jgi:hypothetical protein
LHHYPFGRPHPLPPLLPRQTEPRSHDPDAPGLRRHTRHVQRDDSHSLSMSATDPCCRPPLQPCCPQRPATRSQQQSAETKCRAYLCAPLFFATDVLGAPPGARPRRKVYGRVWIT